MNMSPLTKEVLLGPLPLKFIFIMFNKYSDDTNLIEHIRDFRHTMSLTPRGYPYLFSAFPNNLEKDALV